MGHDWIIDVLADLRSYARQNDLPLLGAQLDEALLVASVEFATVQGRKNRWPQDGQPAQSVGHDE